MMLRVIRIAAAFLLLFAHSMVQAQSWPSKPVRIIAPFAAGGLADVLARALAEKLTVSLGAPFIVENRVGAGGNIGADLVARAEPDGYTLLLSSAGILTINASLYPSMPFDVQAAFAPVTVIADMPMLMVVRGDAPAKNLQEFVALARREPGKLFFGSPGNGTTGHLGMEMFQSLAGVSIGHVPYKSAAEAVTAAVGGQTSGMFDNPPTVLSQIRAGSLRALAVTSGQRLPQLPEVPTMAEAGLPGFEASSWFALVAPAKTPQSVIDRLYTETARALQSPDMQARFSALGARLVGNRPDEFARFIVAERAKWDGIIRKAGIKLN
jgi:tripartite-type tricarboxylate transporter receptor subunit TctC